MITTGNKAVANQKEIIPIDSSKQDIRKMDVEAITTYLSSIGEKPFRSKQIYEWLWNKSVHSFDQMTNLSKSTREQLKGQFSINGAALDQGNGAEWDGLGGAHSDVVGICLDHMMILLSKQPAGSIRPRPV